eukprot:1143642-Pelagomonas_calceolata.AAC.7
MQGGYDMHGSQICMLSTCAGRFNPVWRSTHTLVMYRRSRPASGRPEWHMKKAHEKIWDWPSLYMTHNSSIICIA